VTGQPTTARTATSSSPSPCTRPRQHGPGRGTNRTTSRQERQERQTRKYDKKARTTSRQDHQASKNDKRAGTTSDQERHSPRPRPPGVTGPPVLAGAHDPLDDLDWLTAVDVTITARSPQQPGPRPSPTTQQARPWPDRPLRNPRRVAHRARAPDRSPTTPDLNDKISPARGTRRPLSA
jgi:hypothetical protein